MWGLDSFLSSAGTRNAPILRDFAMKLRRLGHPADKRTIRLSAPRSILGERIGDFAPTDSAMR